MPVRCIICSRLIEDEELPNAASTEDDEDMPKKPMLICKGCQAKLKNEADGSQKVPKPM